MESNANTSIKLDIYQIVTDRIIELLNKGTPPWRKPWTDAGVPKNLLSKRPYRGINLWLLLSLDYTKNLFLTWDQLKSIGGSVKQGEHGHIIVFWKTVKKESELEKEEKERKLPLLRYYKVFNIDQCKDIPNHITSTVEGNDLPVIAQCEDIVKGMQRCPSIKHEKPEAFYDTQNDLINMPKRKSFKSPEGYYGTLYHELIHSTGHESRLARKSIVQMAEYGSDMYSLEELVAEIGCCYLCSHTGILQEQMNNSAAYLEGWLSKLQSDKRFIIYAASYAQRAVDFILGTQKESETNEQIEESRSV